MPYVDHEGRVYAPDRAARLWVTEGDHAAGELNFKISTLLAGYINTYGKSYGTINDVLGALEGAKLEFYRRVAVPYEEKKLTENGDVY